jgi:hypothetical protein
MGKNLMLSVVGLTGLAAWALPAAAHADGEALAIGVDTPAFLDTDVKAKDQKAKQKSGRLLTSDSLQQMAAAAPPAWVGAVANQTQGTVSFFAGYLGRNLTPALAQAASSAGFTIVSVWEFRGCPAYGDAKSSEAAGEKFGLAAFKDARDLGQPTGTPIYFSFEDCERSSDPNPRDDVKQYFKGVNAALTKFTKADPDHQYAVGVYASLTDYKFLASDSLVTYFFEALDNCKRAGKGKKKTWTSVANPSTNTNIRQLAPQRCLAEKTASTYSKTPVDDGIQGSKKHPTGTWFMKVDVDFNVEHPGMSLGSWTPDAPANAAN